jgi:phage shock protein PspC (stress-responsive transcriptional regulator)
MDIADQLQKLQSLREQGALTEEEFVLAKRRVLDDSLPPAAEQSVPMSPSALHRLKRSPTDRWIGGVCGGLAGMTNLPSWTWRILFLLTTLLHGIGVLAYILLWIFIPLQPELACPAGDAPKRA